MMRKQRLILLAALGFAALVSSAQAAPPVGDGSGGVRYVQIGSFDEPVHAAAAPGRLNSRLLFAVEKPGRVMVVRNGIQLATPFLDIADRVDDEGERGLLSIAFHPGYATNRRFYVYFTNNSGDNEIWEFRRRRRSRVRAKLASGRRVLAIPHPDELTNHNGGQIAFGPDGLLYAAPGDGAEDPEQAQDTSNLLGKLVRIDPRRVVRCGRGRIARRRARRRGLRCGRGPRPYTSPRGNPFAGRSGRDEIYALGLRNPWRFSFDSRTGAIAIGDVGGGKREEINFRNRGQARGVNFGWPRWEGTAPGDDSVSAPGAVFPIHEYPRDGPSAVIAGVVVRDPRLTRQYGRLLYIDLFDGVLRSLIPSQAGASDDQPVGSVPSVDAPVSFGVGRKRRIYLCSQAGPVYRLDPS